MGEIKKFNRTNDYAFKRILGSEEGKDALLAFINAVLKPQPGHELVYLDLVDREIDPKHILQRGARLDVLAKTEHGVLINVEVQVANQYNIDKRTMFYWAGLYYGQLGSGQNFKELRKTITINIIGFNWFKDDKDYHNTCRIRVDKTGQLFSDDLEFHFLELEKVKKLNRKPEDALEEWLMYLSNLEGKEMEAVAKKNPAIRKALTIEEAFRQSAKERRIYELREKAIRDEISMLEGAREEGIVEGEAKGEAKAKQDAIYAYLNVKFPDALPELQGKIGKVTGLDELTKLMTKLFTVNTLEDVRKTISNECSSRN